MVAIHNMTIKNSLKGAYHATAIAGSKSPTEYIFLKSRASTRMGLQLSGRL